MISEVAFVMSNIIKRCIIELIQSSILSISFTISYMSSLSIGVINASSNSLVKVRTKASPASSSAVVFFNCSSFLSRQSKLLLKILADS